MMNLLADLLFLIGGALLAWSGTVALQNLPAFPLQQVVVATPVEQVSRAQIEHTARTVLTGNFFTVNLDASRAAFERMPWVRSASLRRLWPDGVELSIEEHRAAARWTPQDGESRLVNGRGEVFLANTEDTLPRLIGPEGSAPRVLERYRAFSEALAATGRKPVLVRLSAREAWQVKLDDGVVLELGRDQAKHPLAERLDRYANEPRRGQRGGRGPPAGDRHGGHALSQRLRTAAAGFGTVMSKETKRDLIVGLDIGTSKIVAIVGELDAEGRLGVLGHRHAGVHRPQARHGDQHRGHGEFDLARHRRGRDDGRLQGARGLYRHRRQPHQEQGFHRHGRGARQGGHPGRRRACAIEAANATSISADDQILHTLVQEFIVDGQDGVKEPIGMDAKRLDVKVHLVTGAVTAVQNIVKCVHRCGLEVVDLVLQPLASGYAVLTEDEKDVGVCLVDIGGGTTDVAVFVHGAIRHTAVIPIAGDQLTNDIAIALRTSTQDAEDIKIRYGVACSSWPIRKT
jgi:cell division septal protein FtsQ